LTQESNEVAIDLETSPQKPNLVPGAEEIPTTKSWIHAEGRTSEGSTPDTGYESTVPFSFQDLEVPQNTTSLISSPSSISQAVPVSVAGRIPPTSPASSKEAGISTADPNPSAPKGHKCDMDTSLVTTAVISLDVPVPAVVSPPQHGFPARLLPKVKTEHKKALKRPAEFLDLTIDRQVHKKVVGHSKIPMDITNSQSSIQITTNHGSMTGNLPLPAPAFPIAPSGFSPMIKNSVAQSFPVDVDDYIPSRSSSAVTLKTGVQTSTVKRDPVMKCEVGVTNNYALESIGMEDELRELEEEAARAATELEDAMRVAEARRQMNGVKRKIDQLKSRGRSFT
jgi:hypothetical protein